jgi:hypothetical protein
MALQKLKNHNNNRTTQWNKYKSRTPRQTKHQPGHHTCNYRKDIFSNIPKKYKLG